MADELQLNELEMPWDRDVFMRTLIRTLADTLEDVVGPDETASFVSMVGQEMGNQLDADYRERLGVERLSQEQVAEALVDLKRRIGGDFFVAEADEDRIVLGNRRCPFGEKVVGQPGMCMMTSNVFGVIAAENLGYGRVEIEESIAGGAPGCRVVVHLQPPGDSVPAGQREYYRA